MSNQTIHELTNLSEISTNDELPIWDNSAGATKKVSVEELSLAVNNTVNSYSTEEVNTGAKWIDGKPIYRKVVDCGALPNNTTKQVAHNISNVGRFIRYYGTARANTGTTLDIPYLGDSGYNYSVFVYLNNTNISVVTKEDRSAYVSTYIILEYTKTTD